jgi:hypothetical protein
MRSVQVRDDQRNSRYRSADVRPTALLKGRQVEIGTDPVRGEMVQLEPDRPKAAPVI